MQGYCFNARSIHLQLLTYWSFDSLFLNRVNTSYSLGSCQVDVGLVFVVNLYAHSLQLKAELKTPYYGLFLLLQSKKNVVNFMLCR